MSPSDTPEFNAFEERFHRTIGEMAHSMRAYAKLPKTFWGLAWESSVYIINRLPTRGVPDDLTPFQLLTGKKPDLSHMRIFGCPCYAHSPKKERKDKLSDKAIQCRFVGYDEQARCYKLVDSRTYKLVRSRDVIFV